MANGLGLDNPRRTTTALVVGALFALAQVASAQVGLSSRTQQIALLARVPAQASLPELTLSSDRARGSIRERSVRLRLGTNTGYRLLVRGAAAAGARVWVRAADGQFHELVAGSPITVARDATGHRESEREVQYRIETRGKRLPETSHTLYYEVALDPAL